jgi:hypothetical protein
VNGPCHELLARARFSGQQYRAATAGGTLDEIECIAQHRAATHDTVETIGPLYRAAKLRVLDSQSTVGLFQLALQAEVVYGQAVHLRPLAHGGEELVDAPGFRQVTVDPAGVDGFDERVDVAVSCKDDADQVRIRLRRAPDQLRPRHPRHALVDDRDRNLRMGRKQV